MDAATGTTVIATGMLPFLLLVSAGLTAPVSLLLLWRYRRAVIKAMAGRTGTDTSAPRPPATHGDMPRIALRVERSTAASLARMDSEAYRQVRRSLAAAIGVYCAAGLAYAVVMTSAWMVFTRADGFPLTRLFLILVCYAWPIVLAVCIVAAVSPMQRTAATAIYFAIFAVIGVWGLARNPDLTVGQLVSFWLLTNGPATVLLLAFLHRRVRAVGPLVLAFMVVAVTGSQVLLSLVGASERTMRLAVEVGGAFALGGHETFYAIIIVGFAAFGVGGWWLLKWLGRRYRERRMSDQTLTLDSMWLLFGIEQSIGFAFQGWTWVFTGLFGFAVYIVVARFGFARVATPRAAKGAQPTLLLLRVFALGRRSERLFHAFAKLWLRRGSISMIAGPDLVATTIEPHEFLEFMGGELTRQFVTGSEDLERRVRSAASGPDPDGRYRVNEFFCFADTWQITMKRLAAQADAVLMDLRSFSASHQGCLFEIEQLLEAVDLRHVVLLVDDTTDQAFLARSLEQIWLGISGDSPNRRSPAPRVRVLDVAGGSGHDSRILFNILLGERAASEENRPGSAFLHA